MSNQAVKFINERLLNQLKQLAIANAKLSFVPDIDLMSDPTETYPAPVVMHVQQCK